MRLFVLAGLLAAAVHAAEVPLDSKITAVTVYQDRAVVTRNAGASIGGGISELVFANLPESLNEQSLQVAATGDTAAIILEVSSRQTYVDQTPNPRVKELEDHLDELRKQTRDINNKAGLLASRSSALEKMESAFFAPPSKDVARPEPGQFDASLKYLMDQRAQIVADRTTLDDETTELKNRIETVQRQLKEISSSGKKAFKTVTVRVSADQPGKLDVDLAYTVPNASWIPNYDVRDDSNARKARLDYFGIVRQTTGEDWNNVALTLSTAKPSLGGAAPILTSWQVDVYVPPTTYGSDNAVMEKFEVSKSNNVGYYGTNRLGGIRSDKGWFADGDSATVSGARLQSATVDAAATSAAFKVEVASTIPSDNSPKKVPIASMTLDAPPEYVTAPKSQTAAFLTSKVTNTSEFPLLAGPMNVFLDGIFVATSGIRTVMPGEKFDLALGVDEGISIKHRRVQKFSEETGLTSSGRRITYEYLLTIQNNKKSAEKVLVFDQVPTSKNEKIVVKVQAPDAKEVKPTDEGALKWNIDLKPGEKRELTVKFTISYPGDIVVAGLD